MLDKNKIYEFCLVCLIKLENQDLTYIELVDYVCDEFDSLGIKKDEGKSFFDKYGNALNDSNELKKIIDEINSVHLLGSAIYSYCMNINLSYYLFEEIVEDEDRKWLSLAFTRLSLLTKKPDNVLQGVLKKICIISNNIIYGQSISTNEEVKQKLTISDDGEVYFKGYSLNEETNQYEIIRIKAFKIDEKDVNKLFHAIYYCFSIPKIEPKSTDCGEWFIELTNMEGKRFKFEGSFDANLFFEGESLSRIVRNALCMNDLYVFDGESKCDIINKITIDYHQVLKVKSCLLYDCDPTKITTFNNKEHLIIDRLSKTLELIRESDTGYRVSHKYEFIDDLNTFLDYFSTKDFFSKVEGNPSDVIIDPNSTDEYKITIEYKDNSKKIIEGSFDKYGLPTDFEDFANPIIEIMIYYGKSDILNSDFFNFVRPCKSDYIVYSVSFDNSSKTYYYLGDERFKVGDFVIVPTGSDNKRTFGTIEKIEYFKEDNLPIPKQQLKKIIRKKFESNDDPIKIKEFDDLGTFTVPWNGDEVIINCEKLRNYCKENNKQVSDLSVEEIELFTISRNENRESKFKDLEEVRIKETGETGIIVDVQYINDKDLYYYLVEMDIDNKVYDYYEDELEKMQ